MVFVRDFIEYVAFGGASRLRGLLPLALVRRLGAIAGRFAFSFVRMRRKATIDNLRCAYPEKSAKEVLATARGAYENFGVVMFEFMGMWRLSAEEVERVMVFDNLDLVDRVLERGRGALVLSAHFGNWEYMALGLGHAYPQRLTLIVQEQRNRYVDRFTHKSRCRLGNSLVQTGKAAKRALTVLRRGGLVAILGDQSGPEDGLYTEFIGRMASTHDGPARLSLRSDAPILFGLPVRQPDGNYVFHFEEVDQSGLPDDQDGRIRQLTRRHVEMLEHAIRLHPEQWLWLHRRWKHVLPNDAPVGTQTRKHKAQTVYAGEPH